MRRHVIETLRRQRDESDQRSRTTTKAFSDLSREHVDLMMFAEAFAEELEGRRDQAGRPMVQILAEYRERYPFE